MEKKVRAWSKVSVFLWTTMLVTMHLALWTAFASMIYEQTIWPMYIALAVIGFGFGAMGMDVFHDWGREKELNRIIDEYEAILDEING